MKADPGRQKWKFFNYHKQPKSGTAFVPWAI